MSTGESSNDDITEKIKILATDEELGKKISQLKYPGEERAKEKRVTIEVTLYVT